MNEFERLLDNLNKGEISITHIQIALRAHYRLREDIPEGIKSFICGSGESDSGLIFKSFQLMNSMIGAVETAYYRGTTE